MTTTFDQLPDLEPLTEVRLSKVYEALTSKQFATGIITAYQHTRSISAQENDQNNRDLAANLRNSGFGFCWMDCVWQDNTQSTPEIAILVTADRNSQQRLFDILKAGASKYNQGAFVYRRAGFGEQTCVFDSNGEDINSFIHVRLDEIFELYAQSRSSRAPGTFSVQETRRAIGFFGKLAGLSD